MFLQKFHEHVYATKCYHHKCDSNCVSPQEKQEHPDKLNFSMDNLNGRIITYIRDIANHIADSLQWKSSKKVLWPKKLTP